MSSAFFYRERRLAFVVLSLTSWFGILGLIGQYLPANANVNSRQMTFDMHGNQLTSHWIKKNGRWQFLKISKISKLDEGKLPRTASVKSRQKASAKPGLGPVVATKAPRTTASVAPSLQRRVKKKALRAKLADEIGRWAKIGNRWEWRAAGADSRPARSVKRSAPRQARKQIDYMAAPETPFVPQPEAHWIERDGRWSFELVEEHTIIRNI